MVTKLLMKIRKYQRIVTALSLMDKDMPMYETTAAYKKLLGGEIMREARIIDNMLKR